MGAVARLARFGRRFMNSFFRKFADFLWQQIAVGLALSAAILFFQVHAGLISGAAINASWTALLKPYALVLFLIFIWHFFRTAYVLHVEDHTRHELQSAEIKLLQAELLKAKVGAETRVTAKDWTELADRMEQRCRFLRIDCQWSCKRERIWELKGGHGGVCDGLIRQAGNMLLNSPRVKDTLSEEVKGEMDAFQRWARYMN